MNTIKCFVTLLLVLSCSIAYGQSDPILMKINGNKITKSDFEYAYKKANNEASEDQSVNQFLESFINYKLKVEEAKSLELNKDEIFLKEYSRYLEQSQSPYITDSISPEIVARKIYDRLGQNVQMSQLFVAFPTEDILPKDTLKAYNKIVSIRESAIKGDDKEFEELVIKFSDDSVSRKSSIPGYLGWKTALMLDPEVEEAMYSTELDSISQPIRTNRGYYLIKVFNRRQDLGQINLSHIFFPYPYENSNTAQKDSVRSQAQKVYEELMSGANFAQAATQYSLDQPTASRGGALGWFGVSNPLPPVFEEPLFSLKEGNISQPLEMDYGFHIFKIVNKRYQLPWENLKEQIIKAISQDNRNEQIKELKREKLKKEFPYSLNDSAYNQLETIAGTYHIADSIFFEKIAPLNDLLLLSTGNKEYKVIDFVHFLAENPNTNFALSTDILSHKVNDFILQKLQEEQKASLDEKYPEFHHLTTEYYDGILLFDVMNQEIWTKAQNDTKALQQLFTDNPSKYQWETPRYKGYVIHAKDKSTLKKVKELIKRYPNQDTLGQILIQELNSDSIKNIYIEKGLWGKGENGFIDRTIFKTKNNREIIGYPEFVISGKLINSPETFEDVRGLLISEYQTILEKEWIESLRKKYKVEINDDVLKSIE
uniref:peptidylprolyl isomerase n=1 Tax=uncultured Dysgonomonas sp. TaxID=206096 RepID=UPI002622F99C|nr:peptidylprolyl isomerase [uncultured Dysgonomonas sp.]